MEEINKSEEIKNSILMIIFGMIFIGFGCGMIGITIEKIKEYNEKNSSYVETTSRVVDYREDDNGLKAIVVEYVVDGVSYYKDSDGYSNKPKKIGTIVKVKYNPDNPQDSIWSFDIVNILLPLATFAVLAFGSGFGFSGIKKLYNTRKIKENYKRQENGLYTSE